MNDSESNEDEENIEPQDVCPTTPILSNRPKLQRRRTIDTVQGRQYSSRRTAFQHLQDMFRPMRGRMKASLDVEHEQIPMVHDKPKAKLRRTSSVHENNQERKSDKSSERRRRFRVERRSDTVALA